MPAWPPLEDLLPHGPSVRFLDAVVQLDTRAVTCRATIGSADRAFANHERKVPSVFAIEYMAQTVAVFVGLAGAPNDRKSPGFVTAIRQFELLVDGLPLDARVHIVAQCEFANDELGRFACRLMHGETALARAIITAFRPNLARRRDMLSQLRS